METTIIETMIADTIRLKDQWAKFGNPAPAHTMLRRLRLLLARTKGKHTSRQWVALKAEFGGHCCRCLKLAPLAKDHIISLCHGGSDSIDNIQPLCKSCNSAKGSNSFNWVAYRRTANLITK